jgi:hypothetical protein
MAGGAVIRECLTPHGHAWESDRQSIAEDRGNIGLQFAFSQSDGVTAYAMMHRHMHRCARARAIVLRRADRGVLGAFIGIIRTHLQCHDMAIEIADRDD